METVSDLIDGSLQVRPIMMLIQTYSGFWKGEEKPEKCERGLQI